MRREIFSEEHELFRAQFRRFAEREIAPKVAGWNAAGMTDRETWRRCGEEGFLGAHAPEEYGGGRRRFPVRRDPDGGDRLDPRPRADALAPLRHLHALPQALRKRRAEGEVPAAHHLGRDDPRHRDDRARHRLGPGQRADPRDPRRRQLRAERRQDLHLERPDRGSLRRGREDRSAAPTRRTAASACCWSRATRRASSAGASSTSSASRARTPASSSSRTAGCRPPTCSGARDRASRC